MSKAAVSEPSETSLFGRSGLLNIAVRPDILDTISSLSSDEVFTSPRMANRLLDLLPPEVWSDPDLRILDPVCKTGVILRESAKRLMSGLARVIPDPEERRAHVFRNQIYGMGITRLTAEMSRRTVYGTRDACSDFAASITTRMSRPDGNIRFPHREHEWDIRGRCLFCGMAQDEKSGEGRETHAYPFIHGGLGEEFGDVKFDIIIGNPPYQIGDGGHGSSARPIYHLFVQEAKKLEPRFLSMIIPARWYAGGKGLDDFRREMLSDTAISCLVDVPDAKEAFSGVNIEGGVCYFLREDKPRNAGCEVSQLRDGVVSEPVSRNLDDHEIFIRHNQAVSIVEKVRARWDGPWLSDKVSARKPFGVPTNFTDFSDEPFEGALRIYANGRQGWVSPDKIKDPNRWVDKWKIFISKAYGSGGSIPHQITGSPIISKPHECCTETYLVVSSFDNEQGALRFARYTKSRIFRFLVSLRKNTQDLNRDRFHFVPDLPMDRDWTDETLCEYFGITDEEFSFICSIVREM